MEVIDRLVHAVRPEKYPADCHQNKGQKDLPEFLDGRKCPVRSDDVFIFTIVRSKNQRQEQKRMESAPYDKSPVSTMPKAADKEYDQRVKSHSWF